MKQSGSDGDRRPWCPRAPRLATNSTNTALPLKYADVMPRVVKVDGDELWAYEDKTIHTGGAISATIGLSREQWGMRGLSYAEMAPGCYEPKARIVDMNEAGMLASLNFPSAPFSFDITMISGRSGCWPVRACAYVCAAGCVSGRADRHKYKYTHQHT